MAWCNTVINRTIRRRARTVRCPGGSRRWHGAALVGLVLVLGACRVTSAPAGTATVTPSLQWIDDLALLPPGPVAHLEVAYFHHTVRCDSCIEAERLTRKTMDAYFTAEMESGLVALVTGDVDTGQDGALVGKYAATRPSF